ncbi:MAG: MazG family protein [Verrucomicrobiota bacterium]|nr:MazG family protein [Verrucomicrobiota bacterium]
MKQKVPINELLRIMAKLRSPQGCPWDREQDHMSLRFHAVEEVYELMDAIESGNDQEFVEELGDLLLQVVFHCQLAKERNAFDFDQVCHSISEKLVRRHPHVFGNSKAKSVDAVWAQWEQIKKAEKAGTKQERSSAYDGIPRHLPALLKAEKLTKKARKAGALSAPKSNKQITRSEIAATLFDLAVQAQAHGWSAEELLRSEVRKREKKFRKMEKKQNMKK